jgi:hypothetical protein
MKPLRLRLFDGGGMQTSAALFGWLDSMRRGDRVRARRTLKITGRD